MQSLIRILFHLLPLVPLAFGLKAVAVATLLLVVLAYIKVKKLEQQLADLKLKGVPSREIEAIEATKNFWKNLTFLAS